MARPQTTKGKGMVKAATNTRVKRHKRRNSLLGGRGSNHSLQTLDSISEHKAYVSSSSGEDDMPPLGKTTTLHTTNTSSSSCSPSSTSSDVPSLSYSAKLDSLPRSFSSPVRVASRKKLVQRLVPDFEDGEDEDDVDEFYDDDDYDDDNHDEDDHDDESKSSVIYKERPAFCSHSFSSSLTSWSTAATLSAASILTTDAVKGERSAPEIVSSALSLVSPSPSSCSDYTERSQSSVMVPPPAKDVSPTMPTRKQLVRDDDDNDETSTSSASSSLYPLPTLPLPPPPPPPPSLHRDVSPRMPMRHRRRGSLVH